MNYTLNQLEIFLSVVKNKSVSKAAEELFLTQPAVSIQLKNFQRQFDLPLTEMIGRTLYITDFGKEIAVSAQEIMDQVMAIQSKMHAYQGQLTGRLKISVVSTGKYVMPYFLSSFMRENQGVTLEMDVTNKSTVVQSLQNNEVDFALVSILPEKLSVEKIDLLQNKLFLIGKTGQKIKNVQAKDIFNQLPLIFREQGSGTRQTMEGFIQRKRIKVAKKMELTSNEAVKQAVLAGLGFSIMPLIGIRNELRNQELQIIPIPGLPIKTTWSLIWLKGKKHAPVAAELLKYIKKEKSKIVHEQFDWYEKY
ncbi:MAG: LysR family transcriptional regulator [Sediminibacterium sp.]|jgi:DNA-binding transcriptional LysR family regulator|uniref:LysR family transcriptional regulator n=1 Tax=Sediminibacterium sp. TaxID=1917865 RepID=UPI002AB88C4E|nr:LysR family transcriptional regulator [Sediminibacterium sp.]MDZ4071721.1 LysR family transcriptional regulator [Sediminibacterium sp.]